MTLAIKSLSLFELICDYPYLKINGKVSKDKWQSMFRHLARYVKTCLFLIRWCLVANAHVLRRQCILTSLATRLITLTLQD